MRESGDPHRRPRWGQRSPRWRWRQRRGFITPPESDNRWQVPPQGRRPPPDWHWPHHRRPQMEPPRPSPPHWLIDPRTGRPFDRRMVLPPDFWEQRRSRQNNLFLQFALTFGGIQLLLVTGLVLLTLVFGKIIEGEVALLTWGLGCGVPVFFLLMGMAIFATVRAGRNITHPLAEIMSAADAVALGDLTVRVKTKTPGTFGQLADTFNRMVGELQRMDEQRRNLTADVAHELRTPLHIIQGNLEGLLDGVYQPTPEHLQLLLDETRLLARLIDDLRTLSLAESGHLPLHKTIFNVAEFLNDLATSFEGQAQGITLRVDSRRLAACMIEADLMRLNQVFANLLVNAIRHTPPGGTITLAGEPGGDHVHLQIRDTGQGIAPEDLPHVFDRFWRSDPARTRSDGTGAGLGLAIVRQLVELHGGEVSVTSDPGSGTCFTLRLPTSGCPE